MKLRRLSLVGPLLLCIFLCFSLAGCGGGGDTNTPESGGITDSGDLNDSGPSTDPVDPPLDSGPSTDPVDPPLDSEPSTDPVDPPLDSTDPIEPASLRIRSYPVRTASVDQAYRYRVVINDSSQPQFQLITAPAGATISANGNVLWTPGEDQAPGRHRFVVEAKVDEETVEQSFEVHVSKIVPALEQAVGMMGGTIDVSAPLSPIRGTSVMVPGWAMDEGGQISVGEVLSPAPLPAGETADGGTMDDLKVISLGPSGTTFARPVTVTLPLSEDVIARAGGDPERVQIWTLGGTTGVWERLPLHYVDLEAGLVVTRTTHFSHFVAISAEELVAAPIPSQGGESCPNAVFAPADLLVGAADVMGSWFNGYDADTMGSTLVDVLQQMEAGGRAKFVFRGQLDVVDGESPEVRFLVVNLTKNAAGTIDILIVDRSGVVMLADDGLSIDGALDPYVRNAASQFVFTRHPLAHDGTGTVSVQVYGYFGNAADGDGLPSSLGDSFAERVAIFDGLVAGSDDADCDRILDAWDPEPNGLLPPSVEPVGSGVVRVALGAEVALEVTVSSADPNGAQVTFSALAGALVEQGDLRTHFSADVPGTYEVNARALDSAGEGLFIFEVLVEEAEVNTPPTCAISLSKSMLYNGDLTTLNAIGSDAEQAPEQLSFRWTSSIPDALRATTGQQVGFEAPHTGDFEVSCIANDGMMDGPPTTTRIFVVEKPENSSPTLDMVTPLSATLEIPDGESTVIRLYAEGSDPDGDSLSFVFEVIEGQPVIETVANTSRSATRNVGLSEPGNHRIRVRAVDPSGATSGAVVVSYVVARFISDVDADGDGWPDGMDCDDTNPNIYPGAPEICGDGIDQSCSGYDLSIEDCDADGDGFSIAEGDCDDTSAGVYPGAGELCNGRDDNCNGLIDEGYSLGESCTVGVGACARTGVMICSASGLGSICSATPGAKQAETCNGLDDDCDGIVDNVADAGISDVNNCGGCGVICEPKANQVAQCLEASGTGAFGCAYECAAGFVNLDGDLATGCEYECTPTGPEVCDGRDNTCNGRIDDVPDRTFYNGPDGTAWVGVCRPGREACVGGQWVSTEDEVVPSEEQCSNVDENCDGRIDEGCEPPPECVFDGDCAGGFVCESGTCVEPPPVEPPPECVFDGDCAGGFECVNGRCKMSGGETCAEAIPLLNGNYYEGVIGADDSNAVSAACFSDEAAGTGRDHVYLLSLSQRSYVWIDFDRRDEAIGYSLRTSCDGSIAFCGGPGDILIYELPAGEYYLIVDALSAEELSYGFGVYYDSYGQSSCEVDAHCSEGDMCVQGMCEPDPTCAPSTCADLGKQCGAFTTDGCGVPLECGTCSAGSRCDQGMCLDCGSDEDRCAELGYQCGIHDDTACGMELDCAGCPAGEFCSSKTCLVIECAVDADCAEGARCDGQLCVQTGQSCIGAIPLTNGYVEGVLLASDTDDVPAACGDDALPGAGRDHVYTFRVEGNAYVELQTFGAEDVVFSLMSPCGGRVHSCFQRDLYTYLPRGEYYVVVDAQGEGELSYFLALYLEELGPRDCALDGDCQEGEVCDGEGICAFDTTCQPTTCADQGMECGVHTDGCGVNLQCGSCGVWDTCEQGTCIACEPRTCAEAGAVCGSINDQCGGTADCGTCADGDACSAGTCVLAECVTDGDCNSGDQCREGLCYASGASCASPLPLTLEYGVYDGVLDASTTNDAADGCWEMFLEPGGGVDHVYVLDLPGRAEVIVEIDGDYGTVGLSIMDSCAGPAQTCMLASAGDYIMLDAGQHFFVVDALVSATIPYQLRVHAYLEPDGSFCWDNFDCPSGQICQASTNRCIYESSCEPTTCAEMGYQCGSQGNGCGGTLDCGSCPDDEICSSGSCVMPECLSSEDCVGGETCESGFCKLTGQTCDGAIPVIDGSYLIGVIGADDTNAVAPGCFSDEAPGTGRDRVYLISLSERSYVSINFDHSDEPVAYSIQTSCGGSNAFCGLPGDRFSRELPAGEYYLVIDALTAEDAHYGVYISYYPASERGCWAPGTGTGCSEGDICVDNMCEPDPTCVPSTCADLERQCGDTTNGCGVPLVCGECAAGNRCEEGICLDCGTTEDRCAELGYQCGTHYDDACGMNLDCPGCPAGEFCAVDQCLLIECAVDSDCAVENRCQGQLCVPTGMSCNSAIPLQNNHVQATIGELDTNDVAAACGDDTLPGAGRDHVYSFRVEGQAFVDIYGYSWGMESIGLSLMSPCGGRVHSCFPQSLSTNLPRGDYYVVVDANGAGPISYELSINVYEMGPRTCATDANCREGEMCDADGICAFDTTCQPLTCADQALECGVHTDGCGVNLQCGSCGVWDTCGQGTCIACEPRTCAEANVECGAPDDYCGGTADCGTCADGDACSAGTCVLAECVTDVDCNSSEECSGGLCLGTGKSCEGPLPMALEYGVYEGVLDASTTDDVAPHCWDPDLYPGGGVERVYVLDLPWAAQVYVELDGDWGTVGLSLMDSCDGPAQACLPVYQGGQFNLDAGQHYFVLDALVSGTIPYRLTVDVYFAPGAPCLVNADCGPGRICHPGTLTCM